ncbi:MAG: hypothetical protein HC914_21075, partial [Chloroflexaceae bacterium]|nr:hypothetical protein [Chloroflexaceae bacterium]
TNDLGLPVLPESDNGDDSDGDGLTDAQEALIGTNPNLDDSDGDGLLDGVEVRGFSFNGRKWYSDPNEPDSNVDGIADIETVRLPTQAGQPITLLDTDGDSIPNLFDDDIDNDGVPNTLDLSPSRSVSQQAVLNFSITNLENEKPTLVDFQFRPGATNGINHLQLAENVFDWPEDRQGTIQDGDNGTFASSDPQNTDPLDSQGDMRLVPMLEIRISTDGGAATNLPLTPPRVTVDLQAVGNSNVAGQVTLTEQDGRVVVTDNLPATAPGLDVRDGTCENPRGPQVAPINLRESRSLNGTLRQKILVNFPASPASDGSDPVGLHIRALDANGNILACGNMVRPSLEGDQMIDQELLTEYGITVRDADDKSLDNNTANGDGDKLIYVPLRLVRDEQTGQRVAFAGRMFYLPRADWERDHQAQLVWAVSILSDVCAPEGFEDGECQTYAQTNVPQVVHTYTDELLLTGLEVREDHGANLAVLYEDPTVDQNVADDGSLTIAAVGLRSSFLEDQSFDLDTLENRFDRTRNASVPADDTLGLNSDANANILRVERHNFAHIDELLAGTTLNRPDQPGVSQELLDRVFKPVAQGNPDLISMLLFARQERMRGLNLDVPSTENTVRVEGNSVTLDMRPEQVQMNEIRGLNWAPFRFDPTTESWESVEVGDYWNELDRRYPLDTFPVVDNDPNNDLVERQGLRGIVRLTHLNFFLGVTSIVQAGTFTVETPKQNAELKLIKDAATSANKLSSFAIAFLIDITIGVSDELARLGKEVPPLLELAVLSEGLQNGVTNPTVGKALEVWAGKNSLKLSFLLADLAILVLSTTSAFATVDKTTKFTIDFFVIPLTLLTKVIKPIKDILDFAKGVAGTGIANALNLGVSKVVKSFSTPGTVFGLVMSAIGIATTLTLFAMQVQQGRLSQGSIEFNLLLASTIASIIVSVILLAISFIPIVGKLIAGIISLIDLILKTLLKLPGFSDLLGQVIAKALYGFELMVAINQEITNTSLKADAEKGMVVGGVLRVDMTIKTTVTEVQPDQDVWVIYLPLALPFFGTLYRPEITLCAANDSYFLSETPQTARRRVRGMLGCSVVMRGIAESGSTVTQA